MAFQGHQTVAADVFRALPRRHAPHDVFALLDAIGHSARCECERAFGHHHDIVLAQPASWDDDSVRMHKHRDWSHLDLEHLGSGSGCVEMKTEGML